MCDYCFKLFTFAYISGEVNDVLSLDVENCKLCFITNACALHGMDTF